MYTFVKNVADKTNADLTVNTENGKVTLDQESDQDRSLG